MDYAFLTFLVTVGTLCVTFLYRKRLLRALGRLLLTESIKFVRATYFVEVEEEREDGTVRVLRPSAALQSLSSSVVPMLVQSALKTVKFKAGGQLPINPATGQLDFMAPVLAKVASGKKVGMEDFLPLIMDKALPFVESFLGSMGTAKPGGGPPSRRTTATGETGRVVR